MEGVASVLEDGKSVIYGKYRFEREARNTGTGFAQASVARAHVLRGDGLTD